MIIHFVLDQLERTTRHIAKVYPNHLRKFCIRRKTYRPQYECNDDVKNERETMVWNFSPTPGPPHESDQGLYCEDDEDSFCSTSVYFRIVCVKRKRTEGYTTHHHSVETRPFK